MKVVLRFRNRAVLLRCTKIKPTQILNWYRGELYTYCRCLICTFIRILEISGDAPSDHMGGVVYYFDIDIHNRL